MSYRPDLGELPDNDDDFGTRSESAPKVKAETVTGESRQAGGNPVSATTLTPEVLAEMKRLDCCGWFTPELAALMGKHRSALIAAAERERSNAALNACVCPECERLRRHIAELEAGLKRIKARSTRMVMCDWAAVDMMVDETLKGGAK